uniref:Uncharacterized protein n=1 Tax=Pristionchus pacificus TaxID=54126 RepID=A0A2A6BCC0_PRIPA|eukprot:PDM63518.1 hypothetical protein PRIPAC_53875 [Pristionchus pacificus]
MAFMSVALLVTILVIGSSTADSSLETSVNATDLASDECMSLEEWMEIPHVTDDELEVLKLAGVLATPSYVVPDCPDLHVYREELKRKEEKKKLNGVNGITPLSSITAEIVESEI